MERARGRNTTERSVCLEIVRARIALMKGCKTEALRRTEWIFGGPGDACGCHG
jgi:hypothetical protein